MRGLTSDEVGQLVERQADAHGNLGVGDVGAARLDALQVRAHQPLGVQQRRVRAVRQRARHELHAVVRDARQLLQRLLLLVQRALLAVAHLVQPQHQLLAARVDGVRQPGRAHTSRLCFLLRF